MLSSAEVKTLFKLLRDELGVKVWLEENGFAIETPDGNRRISFSTGHRTGADGGFYNELIVTVTDPDRSVPIKEFHTPFAMPFPHHCIECGETDGPFEICPLCKGRDVDVCTKCGMKKHLHKGHAGSVGSVAVAF